jgi:hypothetical protein
MVPFVNISKPNKTIICYEGTNTDVWLNSKESKRIINKL